MKRPDLRIRVQLTVSVCLFTLVCLVSLAVAIYTLSRNTLLGLERGNLDLNCRMLREECRQEFEDMYESFYRLSYSSPVQQIYENYTDTHSLLDAAGLLHDSFGADRILLMKLYLSNGTEIMEVDSPSLSNRSSIPPSLLPLTDAPNSTLPSVMHDITSEMGRFVGPEHTKKTVAGASYLLSVTLPIINQTQDWQQQSYQNSSDTLLGFATILVTCSKIEHILSSVAISSASNEVSAAALCSANSDYTEFQQLIPFYDQSPEAQSSSGAVARMRGMSKVVPNSVSKSRRKSAVLEDSIPAPGTHVAYLGGDLDLSASQLNSNFPIPSNMANSLRNNVQPTAQVNKGPGKSMISTSQFNVLSRQYYVVLLQSKKSVFSMPHHLRNAIVISSCAIGGGMIIFTFLFVSFGARQILRLKMAATYEQQTPSKWFFLPLPWWLRPAKSKHAASSSEKSEFRVPEKVPLRKHVRDELDDITERFNIMSNELRKQYSLLEDRVRVRKEEIEQAKEAADLANAAKSHFLARVTHELRTPLNGIIGTATLCLEEDNIQNIHQSLRTIFKCGELLLHLMTDLLSFSQSEVENLDLELRDFSLKEITSQLTAIFSEQCANKKIRLVVSSEPEDDKYAFTGDTNRILQVIFNLMSNGIKFTPEGGCVAFNAKVDANPEDAHTKWLTFYVQDNGPGIVPEMQAKVFEAFVQGDISTHAKKAGVGLGLSICRQLAERMDGSIRLESEVGKGSTFIFKVPLKYRIFDGDSTGDSGTDSLDVSSTATIFKNGRTAFGTPLGTPLDKQKELAEPFDGESSPSDEAVEGDADEKTPDSEKGSGRSVLSRTLWSTSQRTKGLLSSRRRTQSSVFAPREYLKRKFSTDTVMTQAEQKTPSEPSSPKSMKTSSRVSSQASISPVAATNKSGASTMSPMSSERQRPRSSTLGKADVSKSEPNLLERSVDSDLAILKNRSVKGRGADLGARSASSSSSSSKGNAASTRNVSGTTTGSNGNTSNGNPGPSAGSNRAPSSGFDEPTRSDAKVATRPPMPAQKKSFYDRPPSNIRVLVVDDNSVNQEVMMRMLNLEGLTSIKVANDGLDAIEKIKQADIDNESFDVIFMDVQMPNMDGRQATRKIRTEMHKTVPIVAVSAFANEKNADDCIEAGMNLFLSKPLRRPHLREILRSLSSFTDPPELPL